MKALDLDMRPELVPLFKKVLSGVSEYTFANLYLFKETHNYMLTRLDDSMVVVTGTDEGERFFMLPFGIPSEETLKELFERFGSIKAATCEQARTLERLGYSASEDRDNFDYIYLREDLATLKGRRFHKKRNLIKGFAQAHECEARALTPELKDDALKVLDRWVGEHGGPGDSVAARGAINNMEALELTGRVYYIDDKPAAFTMGETLPDHKTFVTHFEKGSNLFKGLVQYVNMDFANHLPEAVAYINREQDLGEEGLRQAKQSYRPLCFGKKYRVERA